MFGVVYVDMLCHPAVLLYTTTAGPSLRANVFK